MKTVVGLYNDKQTANQIVQALVRSDISQDMISLVTDNDTTTSNSLRDTLITEGVNPDEAGYYAEGVRRGNSLVTVQVDDAETDEVVRIMNRYNPIDVHNQAATWRREGWTDMADSASTVGQSNQPASQSTSRQTTDQRTTANTGRKSTRIAEDQDNMNIPVVEEEISVGKREVEQGGVRIHMRVEEQPVEQQVNLQQEKVTVERRPVNRATNASDLDAFKEGTFEVSATSEEAVVEKRARVVEEVAVKKDATEHTETVRDTVRKTKVDVEQTGGAGQMGNTNFDASAFRTHYQSNYANGGRPFEQYEPAYRYGYTLANDARYQGRDWNAIEADARRDWTQNHKGSAWEDFKDSVRYSWERAKNAVTS